MPSPSAGRICVGSVLILNKVAWLDGKDSFYGYVPRE